MINTMEMSLFDKLKLVKIKVMLIFLRLRVNIFLIRGI